MAESGRRLHGLYGPNKTGDGYIFGVGRYVYMYVCMYVCMLCMLCMFVCLSVCLSVCLYPVCVYVCVCVCMSDQNKMAHPYRFGSMDCLGWSNQLENFFSYFYSNSFYFKNF